MKWFSQNFSKCRRFAPLFAELGAENNLGRGFSRTSQILTRLASRYSGTSVSAAEADSTVKKIADKNWVLSAYDDSPAGRGNSAISSSIQGKAAPATGEYGGKVNTFSPDVQEKE